MPDRGKVIKGLDICANGGGCKDGIPNPLCPYSSVVGCDLNQILLDALTLLKEQEDDYKIILSDYEDLEREHEKLLDKKIPLITNGQEIIRCKDCKFYQKPEYGFTKGDCTYGSVWYQTEEDGFCSKAKVKD